MWWKKKKEEEVTTESLREKGQAIVNKARVEKNWKLRELFEEFKIDCSALILKFEQMENVLRLLVLQHALLDIECSIAIGSRGVLEDFSKFCLAQVESIELMVCAITKGRSSEGGGEGSGHAASATEHTGGAATSASAADHQPASAGLLAVGVAGGGGDGGGGHATLATAGAETRGEGGGAGGGSGSRAETSSTSGLGSVSFAVLNRFTEINSENVVRFIHLCVNYKLNGHKVSQKLREIGVDEKLLVCISECAKIGILEKGNKKTERSTKLLQQLSSVGEIPDSVKPYTDQLKGFLSANGASMIRRQFLNCGF